LFEGFEKRRIETPEAEIELVRGGDGPPLLLLHGYPQTHAMWHLVATALAEDFTVVATDLRGYGDSSKPFGEEDHSTYSKRAMAGDQAAVMASLGFDSFAVVGHDRGGRVAHRIALDFPDCVTKLAVLDIVPTRHVFETVGKDLATAYYHWFFFIQPAPLPERLIDGDPIGYLHALLGAWGSGLSVFAPEALAEYERCFADADARHAMLEDYRAGASIDLEHDRADVDRKVEVPTLVVWGENGVVGRRPENPLDVWRERASDVRGTAVDAGHFLVEERPAETLDLLAGFLAAARQ
jgi:haloacetate dehalogenase